MNMRQYKFYLLCFVFVAILDSNSIAQVFGNPTVRGFKEANRVGVGSSRVQDFRKYATGINHAAPESNKPQVIDRGYDTYGLQVSALSLSTKLNYKVTGLTKRRLINAQQRGGSSSLASTTWIVSVELQYRMP